MLVTLPELQFCFCAGRTRLGCLLLLRRASLLLNKYWLRGVFEKTYCPGSALSALCCQNKATGVQGEQNLLPHDQRHRNNGQPLCVLPYTRMYQIFFRLFGLDGSHLMSSHTAFVSAAARAQKDVFVLLLFFFFLFCWLFFYSIARGIFSMYINDSGQKYTLPPFLFSHDGGLFCNHSVVAT